LWIVSPAFNQVQLQIFSIHLLNKKGTASFPSTKSFNLIKEEQMNTQENREISLQIAISAQAEIFKITVGCR